MSKIFVVNGVTGGICKSRRHYAGVICEVGGFTNAYICNFFVLNNGVRVCGAAACRVGNADNGRICRVEVAAVVNSCSLSTGHCLSAFYNYIFGCAVGIQIAVNSIPALNKKPAAR